MVDTDIVGCNWLELPAGKYVLRAEKKVKDFLGQGRKTPGSLPVLLPTVCLSPRLPCVSWRWMCCGQM